MAFSEKQLCLLLFTKNTKIMNKLLVLIILVLGFSSASLSAQTYKPYTLALKSSSSISELTVSIENGLNANGIDVVGQYAPADDASKKVLAITNAGLKQAAAQSGNLAGFAGVLKIALTKENGMTYVSFTTPQYWASAYHQKKYGTIASAIESFAGSLKASFDGIGDYVGTQFGKKKAVSSADLAGYHYMFGMPYLGDKITIKTFGSHSAAVAKINKNLTAGKKSTKKVYQVNVGDGITLFGVGIGGADGEEYFVPTIDYGSPKHTAMLPYELLVVGKNVYMAHGRYRFALAFPDLSMGTFMKIVNTPGYVQGVMSGLTE